MAQKVPIAAIVGRANVGKSTLFNAVLKRREAIVAREAGTTRDSLTAKASYRGSDFWLVDTAGMKDPEDDFELTIQEQIVQAAESADVIIVVAQANTVLTEEDRRVARLALRSSKPVLLAINKADKAKHASFDEFRKLGIKTIVPTSALNNSGIIELLDQLVKIIPHTKVKEAPDRLRLAILGRPNVGKSQLFNTLAKKQQAIVADRAGTTRDINRTVVRFEGRELELLDTAGIRRSGKIEPGVERFSVLRALSAIEQADVCLLLMEVNELGVQLDQKIAGLIKEAGKGLILVVSKWDSYEDKTAHSRDYLAVQIKQNYAFVPWAPLVFTSSITGQNVTKLFEIALDIDKRRHTYIPTSELNRWLKTVLLDHPPAGLKNRNPRLNYIVQENDNPTPTFKVYGTHSRLLHWSYKRYLDRRLREAYDFSGTPLVFWFFDKSGKTPSPGKDN